MEFSWESELAQLLNDLLGVQDQLFATLAKKRDCLIASDVAGLASLAPEEERLIAELQNCVNRREGLLKRASQEGLPSRDIKTLATALPSDRRKRVEADVREASARARLLQHHSLTNWVVIQRTLIHLSQMLEIIATGGRLQPTYGGGGTAQASGTLVDQAA